MDDRYDYESMDVTKRRVKSLSNQLVLKAVLYYKLCYGKGNIHRERKPSSRESHQNWGEIPGVRLAGQ